LSSTAKKSKWELFIGALDPAAGEKILDVGAGKGSIANRVLQESKGAEVYAVDPSEKRVALMRRDYPALKSSVAGAESLPFPDSFFDKAYTTMALHHYNDLARALKELRRVLKTGGCFVVLEVDPASAQAMMFRFFGRLTGEHMNFLSEEQLVSRLEAEQGFRVGSSARLESRYIVRAVSM